MDLVRFLLFGGAPPLPPAPPAPLRTSGPLFYQGERAWRWKGVSAFALLDRFARGQDLQPVFTACAGFNLLRVFPYVPVADWGSAAWDQPPASVVIDFLQVCARAGFFVELTLLTDDDPARIAPARALVEALAADRTPNLLLEAGNEPRVHKAIDTAVLRDVLESSPFLYASGDGDDGRWYGTYGTAHTGRDGEWPRRAHDLLEYGNGDGPSQPHPPYRVPWVADEPIRPDQAPGDPAARAADFHAYFAACSLLGAGATFHATSGKFGQPFQPDEATMAAAALAGLDAFPPDAPLGAYRRIDESGRTLRTYVVGNYMVRIRPTSPTAPEPGWTALDSLGIGWSR